MSKVLHKDNEIKRLTEYKNLMLSLLDGKIPVKHSDRESQYKVYVCNEIKDTLSKIEKLRTE